MLLVIVTLFMAVTLNAINPQAQKESKNNSSRNLPRDVPINRFLNNQLSYNQIILEQDTIITDTKKQEVRKGSSEKIRSKNEKLWENIGSICCAIIMFGWLIIEVVLRQH